MESYLAQVVKAAPCCDSKKGVGKVVEVVSLKPAGILFSDGYVCPMCGVWVPAGEIMAILSSSNAIELFRLKRLPPPSELEQYDRELEIELPKEAV